MNQPRNQPRNQSSQLKIENTTVHASAGSGKTYLLVSRIIRLLLAGATPGSILAITFTRKAAAEMQQRLLQRLYELAAMDEAGLRQQLALLDIPVTTEYVQQARCLYEALLRAEQPVKLTTFHAFCQDLLRRFPLEANIPAGFELLERTTALQDEAWEALMQEAATRQDGPLAQALDQLFRELSLFNSRKALLNFLQQRSDWWAYTYGHDNPVEFAMNKLAGQLQIEPGADPLQDFLQEQTDLRRFIWFLEKHDTKTNLGFAASLQQGLDDQADVQQAYQKIRHAFLTGTGEPRARKISKANIKSYGEAGAEEFLHLHEKICTRIQSTDEQLAAIKTYQLSRVWYLAGEHLLQHYQRIKLEQRLLDFTDLEWKSYLLLTQGDNALWVQYKLDTRIDHLLIDEFQDTNPTQWQLVLPLLHEMAASTAERARSIFLVGDAKQSIYRFRRAEPKLFNTASHWLAEHLQAKTMPLNKSWRSAAAIIDFVNILFSEGQLHDQLPDFEYHETVHTDLWGRVSLLPLAGMTEELDETEHTEVQLRNPLQTPRADSHHYYHYDEGQLIAQTISTLIKDNTAVKDGNLHRPIKYSDIILLLRSRTHVHDYEQALRDSGIPYLGAERGTLLDALEVIDMVNLLTWLITPFDNLALAGILRSPLFALTSEDLVSLASRGTGNWYERLGTLAEQAAGSNFARAHELLMCWQSRAGHIPVHDLLDQIYSEANVLARYRSAFPPILRTRVAANLTRFLELALEMDSGRYPSLTRFLNWLAELKQQAIDSPDEPPALGQQERVRLLTIHEAKGLEAPVVFLVDAAHTPSNNTAHEALVIWPAEDDRPDTFLLTRPKQELDPFSRKQLDLRLAQEQCEETNLLYVAVTRAQQLLYISGTRPARGDKLGWYGQIAERYDIDQSAMGQEQTLQESGQLQIPEFTKDQQQAAPLTLDPRLSQALDMKPAWYEIAPSHSKMTDDITSQAEAEDEDGQARGIAIHLMLEQLMQHRADEDMICKQVAQRLGYTNTDTQYKAWWQEAIDLIRKPELQHLFDSNHYHKAYSEVPIYYPLNGQTVHGVIDRLVLTDQQAWLIDYKTHQQTSQADIKKLAEHYRKQMQLYTDGVKKSGQI